MTDRERGREGEREGGGEKGGGGWSKREIGGRKRKTYQVI